MKTEIATKFKETEIGTIPEEWDVLPIYNLADWVNGLAFKNINFSIDGKPVVKIAELKHGITEQTQFTNDTFKDDYFLSKNDLLFSWSGSPDTSIDAFWYDLPNGWLNQHIFKVKPKDSVIINFLYYILKADKQRFIEIARDKQTTGLGHVTIADLKRFIVALPPIEQQKQIAEILSSLDDKIEINQQTNSNLEKVASMLFKRWFIDFNFPDKKDKPYKTSGGKMIESELGEIPDGWQIRLMTDFVNINKGLSYKGSDLNDDGKNLLVGLKCFERGGGFRSDGTKRFSGEFEIQHLLNPGDLIVAMTDLTQGAEVLGKPAIVPNIKNAEHIVASLDVSILRPKTSQISKAYLYTLFMRQETQDFLFGYSNGSTVLHLSIKGLNEFKLVIAPDNIFQQFNNIIEPIFNQIQILDSELQNLETVRDSLLPRLMTGKIRVN